MWNGCDGTCNENRAITIWGAMMCDKKWRERPKQGQDEQDPWKRAVENHLAGWFLTADDFSSANEAVLELLRLEIEASLDPKISAAAAKLVGDHKCTWRAAAISPDWKGLVWATKCGRRLPLLKDPFTHYEMRWCPFCRGELMNEY